MKVAELIEELQKMPQDMTVFVQTDQHFGYYSAINVVEQQKVQSERTIPNPVRGGWPYIHPEHVGVVIGYI